MRNKNQKGFTIVEVMIVLAVAGLILAVVFVAVPALQRNQRNGARRNDVAYIKTTFKTQVGNNGNQIPNLAGFQSAINGDELNYIGGLVGATANITLANTDLDGACVAAGFTLETTRPASQQCNVDGDSTTDTTVEIRTAICDYQDGTVSGNDCQGYSGIYYHQTRPTSSSDMALNESGNSAGIVGGAKCKNAIATPTTIGVDIFTQTEDPDFRQQSAIFFKLEGDDNVYCENI